MKAIITLADGKEIKRNITLSAWGDRTILLSGKIIRVYADKNHPGQYRITNH